MGWGVQDFRVLFLFPFFCQVWLQQEHILFVLLKVFQARFELVADELAGSQQQPVGWQACVQSAASESEGGQAGRQVRW
jgi:hypothetical protein